MWLFWIVAGALSAAAVALVVTRAVDASRRAAGGAEDPTLAVYRRQLTEIDDLAARGLLAEEERRATFAEAGRRLLVAADAKTAPEQAGGAAPRLMILGGVGVALLAGLGLYLMIGAPGQPDEPYKARVAAWRTGDPTRLAPAEMAAVLRELVKDRPGDAQGHEFLGRAQMAAGDPVAAGEAFRDAIRLSPRNASLYVFLGEALASAAEGGKSPEALAAYRQAVALDPANLPARYFLARAQITGGDRDAGLAAWKAIEAGLAPGDPRRAPLEADMAQVLGTGPVQAGLAQAQGADQAAFIQSMVDRLAARLATTPDDPDGWARLVRAYGVLGDKARQAQAIEKARKLFAGRPADLSKVEAEARTGQ